MSQKTEAVTAANSPTASTAPSESAAATLQALKSDPDAFAFDPKGVEEWARFKDSPSVEHAAVKAIASVAQRQDGAAALATLERRSPRVARLLA